MSFRIVFAGILSVLAATPLAAQTPAPKRVNLVDELGKKLTPTKTLVYKKVGDRELHFSIFEPKDWKPTDKRACFVSFHGGGWTGGDPPRQYGFLDHFAKEGIVGISVEYRLMKNGITPFDCVKDGRSALRYVRSHAAELGIDPNKIIASGNSAGGHVAAGTAMFDGIDEASDDLKVSPTPNALVLYYPVIDTSPAGYGTKKCGAKWEDISPLHKVKPGTPPTIIFHGTGDTVTPFIGAQKFDEAMKKAGNRCELVVTKGGIHGHLVYDLDLFAQSLKKSDEFLKSLKLLP